MKPKFLTFFFSLTLLLLITSLLMTKGVFARPMPQETTAVEVIEAVNALRIANGLHPLNTHPVLMEVAQWEANAIAGGAPGHTRPAGLTLGQWLISLGYPLAGDLSLDGYRSENWVAAKTAEQAIQIWLGDGPHTNTMLSPDRSDIGAAIAVSDQVYIVLETALQTNSGEMQTDAEAILTAIPEAYDGAEQSSLLPQYIMPVILSTARPDGDVLHKVQYGQSLWSIAIAYQTTVEQIRLWNNLGDSTSIRDGYLLLVQKSATQPALFSTTPIPLATSAHFAPTTSTLAVEIPTITIQMTPISQSQDGSIPPSSPFTIWIVVIVIVLMVLGIWSAFFIRSPE